MYIYPAKHPFFILRILGKFLQTAGCLAYREGTSSKHCQNNLNSNGYVSTFTQKFDFKIPSDITACESAPMLCFKPHLRWTNVP